MKNVRSNSLGSSINTEPLTHKDAVAVDIRVDGKEEVETQFEILSHATTSITFLCTINEIANRSRILPSNSNCM